MMYSFFLMSQFSTSQPPTISTWNHCHHEQQTPQTRISLMNSATAAPPFPYRPLTPQWDELAIIESVFLSEQVTATIIIVHIIKKSTRHAHSMIKVLLQHEAGNGAYVSRNL